MSHHDLFLADDGELTRTGHDTYTVSLGSTPIGRLVTALRLLTSGLAQELRLGHTWHPLVVSIHPREQVKAALATTSTNRLRLDMSWTELASLELFFLQYYQAMGARVDHIDIEASRQGEPVDLALRFPTYIDTLDEEEAHYRFGRPSRGHPRRT